MCGKLFATSGRVRRHIVMIHQESKAPRAAAAAKRSKGARALHQVDDVEQEEVQMVVLQADRGQDMAVEFLTTTVQHQEEAPWQ